MKKIFKKWNEISLVKRIICGLIAGMILGLIAPQLTVISFLGDLFVGALRAVAREFDSCIIKIVRAGRIKPVLFLSSFSIYYLVIFSDM